jgi:hypothetical protein
MNDVINVIAKMNVLDADEGGCRKSGIKSGYRPNHVFELIDNKPLATFIGEITFNDQEFIYPGEEKVVNVKFLNFGMISKFIFVGNEWWIYEMPNLMAKAEILEVL